jgi:hypothetical protein
MTTFQVNICFEEQADSVSAAVESALNKLSQPMAKIDIAILNEATGKVENMGAVFSVLSADSKQDAEALAAKLREAVGDKMVHAPGGETLASFEAQVARLNGLLRDVMEACDNPTSVGQLREKIMSVVAQARGH